MGKESEVFVGSGNVFADLGLPNPEERQLKAHLSIAIEDVIKRERLTCKRAAQKMDLTPEDLTKIIEGQLSEFSVGQLITVLNCLGREVELSATVRERVPEAQEPAQENMREAVAA
jgi:predicted XRE-type DNA-binding protein